MGATFCAIDYASDLTKDQLAKRVAEECSRMAYESGHSYSGNWGSKDGSVVFDTSRVYASDEEAHNRLEDTDKWGSLLAVKYRDIRKEIPENRKARFEAAAARMHELQLELIRYPALVFDRVKNGKSAFKTCPDCKSKIAVARLGPYHRHGVKCPVCDGDLMYTDTDRKKVAALQAKREKLEASLAALYVEKDHGVQWKVGGWCSS